MNHDAERFARPVPDCWVCFDADPSVAWSVMIVCKVCGNKRCPKATDCRLGCTGSNEPGQPGSLYV